MSFKQLIDRWEPLAKLGGWLYVILGALFAAAAWVTTTQITLAADTTDIRDIKQQIRPIDAIRQDVRWIKKRLGGPDN